MIAIRNVTALIAFCFLMIVQGEIVIAQTPAPKPAAIPVAFTATVIHYIEYPSLNPETAITLPVGTPNTDIYDAINSLIVGQGWDCSSVDHYEVRVVDKSTPPKTLRTLALDRVHLVGQQPDGAPFTSCDGMGHPTKLDLILKSQPKVGDLLQILIKDKSGAVVLQSASTSPIAATDIPTFAATPQAAPGEALNNGTKRTVGQLSIAFADTKLAPHSPISVYAKSTDLLSTDGKDSKSSVALTAGLQRGIFPHWYSPMALEQTLQGNQTAKNLSTVTSLNFNALPPWHWTSRILNNSVISAPLPPEPTISNLYTHRFEQLVAAKATPLAENDYSLNGYFSWTTISFPFTCKLLFWERPAAKTPANATAALAGATALNGTGIGKASDASVSPTTTPASLAAPASTNCLGTEIDLGSWYLPLNKTQMGTQKVEGYGDVSILIPLSDFSVASNELLYATKTDPTKFQIRIKYTDAVNQANNYSRTRSWTFGLEAVK